jgi:peroxiredoxin
VSIADALQQQKPLVIVFATPVFCVSQFCGPITEMIEQMQPKYADKANFIHVEIWSDFQKNAVNKAAADWLLRNGNLNEPWVFLVDRDGIIVKRWDNVATQDEVESALDALLN